MQACQVMCMHRWVRFVVLLIPWIFDMMPHAPQPTNQPTCLPICRLPTRWHRYLSRPSWLRTSQALREGEHVFASPGEVGPDSEVSRQIISSAPDVEAPDLASHVEAPGGAHSTEYDLVANAYWMKQPICATCMLLPIKERTARGSSSRST